MKDVRVGDKVQWEDCDEVHVGTVTLLLSAQCVVHTTKGHDRFVLYNNPTLKPYRQVVT